LAGDLGIPIADIRDKKTRPKNLYSELSKIRDRNQEVQINLLKEEAKAAIPRHQLTLDLTQNMIEQKTEAAKVKLLEIGLKDVDSRFPYLEGLHFIFVLDESASMK
jgi:hypothetical protein